jgi:polyisoprenyl-phosphate glycosyltransferase
MMSAPLASLSTAEKKDKLVSLELIVPVYNEEEVLPLLIQRIQNTFSPDARKKYGISSVSLLFIDDGSQDQSFNKIKAHIPPELPTRIIRFSRTFGHQSGITAGMKHCTSDLMAILDADLQDPPEVICQMIEKWHQGYEIVYGVREKRKEGLLKVFCYWLFYRIYAFLSPIDVSTDSGDFCLMSKRVIKEINKLTETLRFHRGLRSWVGFRQIGLPYERAKREKGESKYDFRKLYKLATNGIVAMSTRPLQITQLFSLLFLFFSIAVSLILPFFPINNIPLDTKFLILLHVNLLTGAIIMFSLYILGAYIGRAYIETKGRPPYIIEEIIDIPSR